MKGVRPEFIGMLIGGYAGFMLGNWAWLAYFYFVHMRPEGIPFRAIDQGTIPVLLTGPLGLVVGVVLGRKIAIRLWKRDSSKDIHA